MSTAPIALVGSGEYLPVMTEIERVAHRRARRRATCSSPPRPRPRATSRSPAGTGSAASRPSGSASSRSWSTSAPARTPSRDAGPRLVEGAGLIYLSGGNPAYLAETLRQHRRVARDRRGARERAPRSRAAAPARWRCRTGRRACATSCTPNQPTGLGLVPHVRVIPHFDKMLGWMPDMLRNALLHTPEGIDAHRHRRGHRARRRPARVGGAGPPVGVGPRPRRAPRAPERQHPHHSVAPAHGARVDTPHPVGARHGRRQRLEREVIAEFRANEGRVGGQFEGAPVVLMHHVGRSPARSTSTR